jgi:polysaccharide biosynthesis/export protein
MKWLNENKFGIGLASLLLMLPCVPGMAQETGPAQAPATPPAATPGAPVAMPASQVDASSYIIGPEDGLQVTVWQNPQISGAFPVRPDGKISLTLLGDVQAAGLTPMQLSDSIIQKLKKFIQDPTVAVVVTAVNSQKVYLVGEVTKVGPVPLTAGMTPLQAIATAGGLSIYANAHKIYILRNDKGSQTKLGFDYKKALKGDSKQLFPLKPGDTIVVP